MNRRHFLTTALVITSLAALAQSASAADPSGTWKWSFTRGDQTRETTLKLKLDGDKLTGTITGRNNQEHEIEEASFANDEVSFAVSRERNGQKFTIKYKGKVEGDTIKGKTEFTGRDGQVRSRDWEAKRS